MTSLLATGLRVLVVDDDRDGALTFAKLLGVHGHDARACFHTPEALAVVETFDPHLVFLDVMMPRMTGIQLGALLRKLGERERTIVALSTSDAEEHRRGAAAAGFDAYLVKPARPEEWLALLAHAQAKLAAQDETPTKPFYRH